MRRAPVAFKLGLYHVRKPRVVSSGRFFSALLLLPKSQTKKQQKKSRLAARKVTSTRFTTNATPPPQNTQQAARFHVAASCAHREPTCPLGLGKAKPFPFAPGWLPSSRRGDPNERGAEALRLGVDAGFVVIVVLLRLSEPLEDGSARARGRGHVRGVVPAQDSRGQKVRRGFGSAAHPQAPCWIPRLNCSIAVEE